jgi:hypothetical protein
LTLAAGGNSAFNVGIPVQPYEHPQEQSEGNFDVPTLVLRSSHIKRYYILNHEYPSASNTDFQWLSHVKCASMSATWAAKGEQALKTRLRD